MPQILCLPQQNIQINIDETTGLVKSVISYGQVIPINQNFYYYLSEDANNSPYVFRPKQGTDANVISTSATVTVYQGAVTGKLYFISTIFCFIIFRKIIQTLQFIVNKQENTLLSNLLIIVFICGKYRLV